MQVVDLFSGVGGFGLGAMFAGFNLAASVDHDANLTSSHSLNFPETTLLLRDLGRVRADTLLRDVGLREGEIDGIIGGPPCQGFSHIGRRNPEDPRNSLVGRFFYFVERLRPQFFVFENVPGILRPETLPMLELSLRRVSKLYTVIGPLLVDAADFGAATHRRRVLVIGLPLDIPAEKAVITSPGLMPTSVRDAICDLPDPGGLETEENGRSWGTYKDCDGGVSDYAERMRVAPPAGLGSAEAIEALGDRRVSGLQVTKHSPAVRKRFESLEVGARDGPSRFPRLRWDKPSPTLRAGTGSERGAFQAVRPIHPSRPRVITVREAARIQGFPDWFQFHSTKWHSFRMIGNSVSPVMAAGVLAQVSSLLNGRKR